MKQPFFFGIILLLTGGLLLNTCNNEYFDLDRLSDEIELEPGLVAPLIYGSLTLQDIIERIDSTGYTRVNDEGLIYIVYEDTAYTVRADTIVDVPDQLVTEVYIDSDINVPVWLGSSPGDTVPFFKQERFTFELDGDDRVDSILVKGGEIVIDVTSSFEHTGLLTISSPQILDMNRDTFSTVVEISDLSGSFVDQKTFLSDGYNLISRVENDTNYIQINFRLDLINSGNIINPDDQCEILTNFLDLDFYSVYGFIDSRDLITENGTFEIPLYSENPDLANLILADPQFYIYISNSVGIPVEVEINQMTATSSIDGSTLDLVITEGHPFQILAPGINQLGQRVDTDIEITRNTSNIDELLAIAPSQITYDISGRTSGEATGDQHFVLDTSMIDLALEILVPLDLKSTGYSIEDTIDLSLGEEGIDTAIIKQLEVVLETVNEIPVHLDVQVYLLDAQYTLLDSIFNERAILLEASSVDEEGKLLEASTEVNAISMTSQRIATLGEAAFARIVAKLNTTNEGTDFVKLYAQYALDFKLSMSANFRINTREL